MNISLFSKTPTIAVFDNRTLTIRNIAYHRHPDSPDVTLEQITHHRYDIRGFLTQSADPRLHAAGRVNFTYLTDLTGSTLFTQGADNGITATLNDAAGRPFIRIEEAVTRSWLYEDATLPGRPLAVMEQTSCEDSRVTERFVYARNGDTDKALNLAGRCVHHYDTAGLVQTDSIALTGVPFSVSRRLIKDADNPDLVADWQGQDALVWNSQLAAETFTTLITVDATGASLTVSDATGNVQRTAYDVAGLLSGSWLTLKGGTEKVIVKSLTYSAAGQKLREEHGNGVVTTYTYAAETQRLTGMTTERPVGHASGARVLQDLRYQYDPVGNVLSIRNDAEETRFWRNQKIDPENIYTYDSLYQLISATGREMASSRQQSSSLPSAIIPLPSDSTTSTNYTRTYTYDAGGNLTRIRHSAPASGNNYTTTITVSDRSNRAVLSATTTSPSEVDTFFSPAGQQKQLQPGQRLSWTLRNELLKVTPVVRDGATDDRESYRYDAGSQRILKVSMQKTGGSIQTQKVLYLPGLELRTTASGATETENLHVIAVGEAGHAQVRILHWESGRPADIGNDPIRYSYDNPIGSSQLELDADGDIISLEEFYPYGGTALRAARSKVEADYKTIRYSGKERDATGLYYYGYRYYQPWAGRWLSADPADTVDGLNLFRMVRNNPMRFHDPDGRLSKEEIESIGKTLFVLAFLVVLFMQIRNGYNTPAIKVDPLHARLKEHAKSEVNRLQLPEGFIQPFEAFIFSEYEKKFKSRSNFYANIMEINGNIYAYSSPEKNAAKAEKIIYSGVDVGRRLKRLDASYTILEMKISPRQHVEPSPSTMDFSAFEQGNSSGTVTRRGAKSSGTHACPEESTRSRGMNSSPKSKNRFTVENSDIFDNMNLSEMSRTVLNRAITQVGEGKTGYKLDNTNEYVVDLPGFAGQKRRGAYRLAFKQEGLKRSLTRIINPH